DTNTREDYCKAANVADIVFIVDESGSIGTANFKMVRTFLHSIVSGLEISWAKVRVGIVMYSNGASPQVYLDSFDDKSELLNFIKILPYRGGGSNTGAALNYARENVFIKARGSRKEQGVQQVAVVITDGKSQDDVSTAAADLRRAGVTIYAIGVKEANKALLDQMASYPHNKHVFNVDNFEKLKGLEKSYGLCPDCKKTEKADIIFLVDGSTSITLEKFRSMQKFMKSVVRETTVGKELTRFGVILYSTNPQSIFTLKQYDSKRQVLKAIDALKSPYGDTYTGRALAYALDYFNQDSGGRGALRVPQILMVITDGDATDRSSLVAPSVALRDNGITVFSIGVEGANKAQLEVMAGGDKSKVFYVDNFEALENLYKTVTHVLCNSTKPGKRPCSASVVSQSSDIQTFFGLTPTLKAEAFDFEHHEGDGKLPL
uniref:VWFA domain-containing protein n=1 Tax=Sparus aurata TaxID=8175 RepID=A0A671U8T7_SPAAU